MTARPTLPINFQRSAPIWYDNFEDVSGWVKSGDAGGTVQADTDIYAEGSQSLAMSPITDYPGVIATKSVSIDASSMHSFSFLMRDSNIANGIYNIAFSPNVGFTKTATFTATLQLTRMAPRGWWNRHTIARSEFVLAGGFSWSDPIAYIRIKLVGVNAPRVNFDDFRLDERFQPKCVIMFDDTHATDYTVGFATMQPLGIPGTCYCNSVNVGLPSRCTLAQLQEMDASGWTICGHTANHTTLTGLPLGDQEAAIQTTIDYLGSVGLSRGQYYFAYPGNNYDADSIVACQNLGILCARAGAYYLQNPRVIPASNIYRVVAMALEADTTLNNAKSRIDLAITTGETIMIFMHEIVTGATGYQCELATFRGVIDYLHQKRAVIHCITIDEWHKGLTNPRYRSLPAGRT